MTQSEERLVPIMFNPKYSWDCMRSRIHDAFHREAAQLDWAIWAAEEDLNKSVLCAKTWK